MNTTTPIALTMLNANLLGRTSTSLVSIVNSLATDHPFIARQVQGITTAQETIHGLKSTTQESEHTVEIHEIDAEIDAVLPVIEDDLESSSNKKMFFRAKGESAEKLLDLWKLRDRRKLIYGGYADQGEEIRILLKDVFDPAMDADRTASGSEPLFIYLKEKFARLNELLELRLTRGNSETTQREQRKIMHYRIDKLIAYIDANILDNVEGFADIQTPINELFTEVMAQYKAEKTRKENAVQEN